jgi:hypothetical protein
MKHCYFGSRVISGTQLIRQYQGKDWRIYIEWRGFHFVGRPQGSQRAKGKKADMETI